MIDLIDAIRHLRIDGNDGEINSEIQKKLEEAIAIAAVYTGQTTRPYDVKDFSGMTNEEQLAAEAAEKALWQNRGIDAAVLLILGDLWANRESTSGDPLSPAVRNVLALYRPVVFA